MSPVFRMPAEWEPHRSTWIGWPHLDADWPGKLEPVQWAYVEIVRQLAKSELVNIICFDSTVRESAHDLLVRGGSLENVSFHVQKYDRTWLRDSGPTLTKSAGSSRWINWSFNAWAKYDNFFPG